MGAHRSIRVELACGGVKLYEGEHDAERLVRVDLADGGEVDFYEGEKGAERMVRRELASGEVWLYEGEKGEEGMVLLTVEEKAACLRRVDGLMGTARNGRFDLLQTLSSKHLYEMGAFLRPPLPPQLVHLSDLCVMSARRESDAEKLKAPPTLTHLAEPCVRRWSTADRSTP